MSGFLDTSIIVRYFTNDPPELAEKAADIIDGDAHLLVTDVVLAETAYVLTSVYNVNRSLVVDNLIAFLQKENIAVFSLDKDRVIQALLLCRPSGRISFADAMVWASARSSGINTVYSLDKRFPGEGLNIKPGL
ncbi:MAG: PIN domain-containing protein [Dehalococcoidales bacterium]|nr:PIN domain-containing protein [Dehalococcoidales bacterium]